MNAVCSVGISLINANLTGCSVSGDTLQYRLEESVSHWRTRQMTTVYLFADAQAVWFMHSTILSVTCL